jgi:hypothetical protein
MLSAIARSRWNGARARRDAFALVTAHPWITLSATSTLALLVQLPFAHATSWHFFADAAHLLFRPPATGPAGGLDVFSTHPQFQFGPLAVLVAAPFSFMPAGLGVYAVMIVQSALGVAAVVAVADGAGRKLDGPARCAFRSSLLFGAIPLVLVWSDIADRTAHLDDAVALAATACALSALGRNRPWIATLALAFAAAAKPWAIVFAPLAVVVPGSRKYLRVVAIAGVVVATWLPFAIDEPSTIRAAGSFKIANAASSALRALGETNPFTPTWVRPTQIVGGLLLSAMLVRRGQWAAVAMAGLAWRLMLDPGVHHYYAAGLTLAVLVWELHRRPAKLPFATVITAIVLEVTPSAIQPAAFAGQLRLALTGALVGAAFTGPVRTPRRLSFAARGC